MTHESTHVLTAHRWGPAGTSLLGEGVAVWASGAYSERPLALWKRALPERIPLIEELLGPRFRQLPEQVAYPLGGLLVTTIVEEVGLDALRDHLYAATPVDWSARCERAGTTAEALARAFRTSLAR